MFEILRAYDQTQCAEASDKLAVSCRVDGVHVGRAFVEIQRCVNHHHLKLIRRIPSSYHHKRIRTFAQASSCGAHNPWHQHASLPGVSWRRNSPPRLFSQSASGSHAVSARARYSEPISSCVTGRFGRIYSGGHTCWRRHCTLLLDRVTSTPRLLVQAPVLGWAVRTHQRLGRLSRVLLPAFRARLVAPSHGVRSRCLVRAPRRELLLAGSRQLCVRTHW